VVHRFRTHACHVSPPETTHGPGRVEGELDGIDCTVISKRGLLPAYSRAIAGTVAAP